MRWQNVETPTFAGSAGSAGEPAVVETMQLIDRDGNEVAAFTKAVDGTIASTVDGQPKVYRALLSQTGTDAPVATVLENTLGGDVVWTRDSAGTYLGTLSNAFTDEKTLLYIQGYMGVTNWDGGTNIQMFSLTRNTSSLVKAESVFGTLGGTWAASDDLLVGQSVEILVYP